MTSTNGFIVLPRKVFNDLSFEGEKFSRREAFLDLVLLASFEPSDIPSRCGTIHLEVGELICSVRTLAVRWGWSIGKVSSVLKEFENEHKLIRKIEHSICTISICSYDLFVGTKDCSLNAKLNDIKQDKSLSSTDVESKDIILEQEKKEKPPKGGQKKNEEPLVFPFSSDAFMDAWYALLREKKWKGKSNHAYQLSLDKLGRYEEAFAIQLINDAIENNWQGVVFADTNRKYDTWKNEQMPEERKANSKKPMFTFVGTPREKG